MWLYIDICAQILHLSPNVPQYSGRRKHSKLLCSRKHGFMRILGCFNAPDNTLGEARFIMKKAHTMNSFPFFIGCSHLWMQYFQLFKWKGFFFFFFYVAVLLLIQPHFYQSHLNNEKVVVSQQDLRQKAWLANATTWLYRGTILGMDTTIVVTVPKCFLHNSNLFELAIDFNNIKVRPHCRLGTAV